MEARPDNSSEQYTDTVTKELEEPAANRYLNLWRKEDN